MAAEIEIKHIQKKYPNGVEALKSIDLEVGKGQLFALLGPNGAGKSTLIRIMTMLIQKDSGEFRIGGMDPESNFVRLQQYIGIASQENELDPDEKTEALLQFQARLFGMSKKLAAQRADELIGLFKLSSERTKQVSELSGGNKRRLHCALALVHHPRILFLDEPTVGMDPLARETFWKTITDLNEHENVTVLLTTQYLEEADKYASDIALIIEGRIHFTGTIPAFKSLVHPSQNASLEESYLTYLKSLISNN